MKISIYKSNNEIGATIDGKGYKITVEKDGFCTFNKACDYMRSRTIEESAQFIKNYSDAKKKGYIVDDIEKGNFDKPNQIILNKVIKYLAKKNKLVTIRTLQKCSFFKGWKVDDIFDLLCDHLDIFDVKIYENSVSYVEVGLKK